MHNTTLKTFAAFTFKSNQIIQKFTKGQQKHWYSKGVTLSKSVAMSNEWLDNNYWRLCISNCAVMYLIGHLQPLTTQLSHCHSRALHYFCLTRHILIRISIFQEENMNHLFCTHWTLKCNDRLDCKSNKTLLTKWKYTSRKRKKIILKMFGLCM